MRLFHRYRSISVLWFTTCSSLAWAAQWLISLRYQQREHFVCSAPLPFQHQSIILFNFQLIEFIGKKPELLQLPLLPGKGRREGKIKIPGNCTTVRSSPSVASRRQPSVRGILPLPVGKHSTLKMHFFLLDCSSILSCPSLIILLFYSKGLRGLVTALYWVWNNARKAEGSWEQLCQTPKFQGSAVPLCVPKTVFQS